MKFKKYLFTGFLMSVFLFAGTGCKKMLDLDINQNPNDPTNAPFRLLLTSAELNVPAVFQGVNEDALGYVGILANQGSDAFDLNNSSYNGLWNSFYQGGMKDLDELLKATANGESPHFRGVAQTLKAYFFSMFVDLFGDVPYSEAFKGNAEEANFTPKFDAAKDIYDDLLKLTDSAQANLAKTSAIALSGDIYYANSVTKWSTLANTVKLYLLIKTRQVRSTAQAEIGAIFTSGKYIKASSG
ncbi:MAG: SusD/RagB family nutrient-binding outer membrane lipoprotein, partial [Chitinophagaceae bacterium]